MPDTSLLRNFNATCGGGLVLNKDVYDMAPGEALQLVNFEPSTEGGYRRLNGTTKYNSTIVPQVSASTENSQTHSPLIMHTMRYVSFQALSFLASL